MTRTEVSTKEGFSFEPLGPDHIQWLFERPAMGAGSQEDAAMKNSHRPEQDAWWADTSGLFDGAVTVLRSSAKRSAAYCTAAGVST